MASILTNPKYQPHGGSELGTNAFTYLKFGLPRVLPPKFAGGSSSAGTPGKQKSYTLKYIFMCLISIHDGLTQFSCHLTI